MPRFSTVRKTPTRKLRPIPPDNSTPRKRLLICLFLPVWILVVVNAHVAIGFFQQVDDSVLVDPVTVVQDSEGDAESPFEDDVESGTESVVEGAIVVEDESNDNADTKPAEQDVNQAALESQVAQRFFIEPDANGDVFGRLTTLTYNGVSPFRGRCTVALVQNGEEVLRTTATNGEFLFSSVPTGTGNETYTLVAYGKSGFLAQTINIGAPRNGQSSYRVPTLMDKAQYVSLTETKNIGKQDFDIPDGQLDLPDLKIIPDEEGNEVQIPDSAIPRSYQVELVTMQPGYSRLEKIYESNVVEGTGLADFDYDTRPRRRDLQSPACFEYELTDEGGFCGRLIIPDGEVGIRDFEDMRVYLKQGSQQIAEVEVAPNGDFEFEGITPGPYGLVAAGNEGFAAMPISLVNAFGPLFETGQKKKSKAETYVGLQDNFDACGCCRVPLVSQPQDIQYIGDVINQWSCLLYTSPSPREQRGSRMPSSA